MSAGHSAGPIQSPSDGVSGTSTGRGYPHTYLHPCLRLEQRILVDVLDQEHGNHLSIDLCLDTVVRVDQPGQIEAGFFFDLKQSMHQLIRPAQTTSV